MTGFPTQFLKSNNDEAYQKKSPETKTAATPLEGATSIGRFLSKSLARKFCDDFRTQISGNSYLALEQG